MPLASRRAGEVAGVRGDRGKQRAAKASASITCLNAGAWPRSLRAKPIPPKNGAGARERPTASRARRGRPLSTAALAPASSSAQRGILRLQPRIVHSRLIARARRPDTRSETGRHRLGVSRIRVSKRRRSTAGLSQNLERSTGPARPRAPAVARGPRRERPRSQAPPNPLERIMKIHAFALGLASLLASAVSFYVPAPTPSDVVASPTPVSYQICNERKVCDNICTNLPSDDPCKKKLACTLAEYAPECAGQNVATGTGDADSGVPTGDGQNEDVWNEDVWNEHVWNEEQEQEHGREQEQEDPSVLISSSRDYEEEEASPVSPEQEQDQEEQTARDCDPWPECVEQQEQEEQTDNEEEQEHQPEEDQEQDSADNEEEQEHQPEEDQEQGESTSSSETTSSDESTSPSGSKSSSESSTATVAWAVPVAIGGVLVSGGGAFLLARKRKTAATQRPEMGALDSQA